LAYIGVVRRQHGDASLDVPGPARLRGDELAAVVKGALGVLLRIVARCQRKARHARRPNLGQEGGVTLVHLAQSRLNTLEPGVVGLDLVDESTFVVLAPLLALLSDGAVHLLELLQLRGQFLILLQLAELRLFLLPTAEGLRLLVVALAENCMHLALLGALLDHDRVPFLERLHLLGGYFRGILRVGDEGRLVYCKFKCLVLLVGQHQVLFREASCQAFLLL